MIETTAPPTVQGIDHVHVYVSDRVASEAWYSRVLGFVRMKEYEFWAEDGGPLTIQNLDGTIHIALFERPAEKCRSTIALGANASEFLAWKAHLGQALNKEPTVEDHDVSYSLYFQDLDGNPYEITTYEYQASKRGLAASAA